MNDMIVKMNGKYLESRNDLIDEWSNIRQRKTTDFDITVRRPETLISPIIITTIEGAERRELHVIDAGVTIICAAFYVLPGVTHYEHVFTRIVSDT